MKSYKNLALLIIGFALVMVAFSSCGGESVIPSDMHSQPVHGESKF